MSLSRQSGKAERGGNIELYSIQSLLTDRPTERTHKLRGDVSRKNSSWNVAVINRTDRSKQTQQKQNAAMPTPCFPMNEEDYPESRIGFMTKHNNQQEMRQGMLQYNHKSTRVPTTLLFARNQQHNNASNGRERRMVRLYLIRFG